MASINEGHFFVATDGEKWKIKPVSISTIELIDSSIKEHYRKNKEPIDPPTYEAQILGGKEIEVHKHDETTLDVPDDEEQTAENHKIWDAYQDAIGRMSAEIGKAQQNLWMTEGLDVKLPQNKKWLKGLKAIVPYLVEPEDKEALRSLYIETQILKTYPDIMKFVAEVSKLSYAGIVSEEQIDAEMSTFRNPIQQDTAKESSVGEEGEVEALD